MIILATGVTNLIGGFLAYFGLAAFIRSSWEALMEKHGQVLITAELILGFAYLLWSGSCCQGAKCSFKPRELLGTAMTAMMRRRLRAK